MLFRGGTLGFVVVVVVMLVFVSGLLLVDSSSNVVVERLIGDEGNESWITTALPFVSSLIGSSSLVLSRARFRQLFAARSIACDG